MGFAAPLVAPILIGTAGAVASSLLTKRAVPPPMPTIEKADPIATPETGGDPLDILRRMRRTSGRASTILTGDLIPPDVKKRTLLG